MTPTPAAQRPVDSAPAPDSGVVAAPSPAPDPASAPTPAQVPSLLDDPQVRRWGPVVALVLLAFLFLFPSIRGMYIWDDPQWLTKNTTIQSGPMGLWKVWTDYTSTPHYYPLVFTTYWLEYRQWGLGTMGPDGIIRGIGYHVDNLLLHIAGVLLLFSLLKGLRLPGGKAGAWIAAAIWAIHPMTVESVAWVAERKNVLSGVFFLASLLVALKFFNVIEPEDGPAPDAKGPRDAAPAAPRWGLYAASLALFLCAMLSKTATCFLPPAVLVLIWWKRGRITLREIALTLPLFVLAIGFGALTAFLESQSVGANGPEFAFSFTQRLLIAGNAVFFYIGKLFRPFPVMQIYPRWDIVAGQPITQSWLYIAPIAAIAIGVLLFLLRGRITRGPLAAYLLFLGGLFPVMGFINYYTMIYTFVADHYQYLAGIAIIVLAVEVGLWLLRTIARQVPVQKGFDRDTEQHRFFRITAGLLFGGLILSLGSLAFGAASLYQDSRELWDFNTKYNHSRGAFGVWHNLADAHFVDFHDRENAMKAYQEAVKFYPNWNSYHTMGIIALDQDTPQESHLDEALRYLKESDRLMPAFVREGRRKTLAKRTEAYNAGIGSGSSLLYGTNALIGEHLMSTQRAHEAIPFFRADLQENPGNPIDLFQIGQCLQSAGDYAGALTWYQQAVDANPRFVDAWLQLAAVAGQLHLSAERRAALLRVYQLDPQDYAFVLPLLDTDPAGLIGPPAPSTNTEADTRPNGLAPGAFPLPTPPLPLTQPASR
jgi:tetratricopeptide (TPR) repeat protein